MNIELKRIEDFPPKTQAFLRDNGFSQINQFTPMETRIALWAAALEWAAPRQLPEVETILAPFLETLERMEGRADDEITEVEIVCSDEEDAALRASFQFAKARSADSKNAVIVCAMDSLTVKDWRALKRLLPQGDRQ